MNSTQRKNRNMILASLYFGSLNHPPSHTVALLSYIDPILAIFLSVVLLWEPMTPTSFAGAVMILTAACLSEK